MSRERLYRSFNESKHVVTWWNNSTTRFGYCQSENDVYQYQGAEFLFIGIDELTLFTLRQWQFLTSRNRCAIPGAFPCMAGATNPGNIGHAWVKSLWIDRQPAPGMEHPGEYDGADYDFIPARVSDNPIYAHDENYLKTLRALPSHLKRAFLDGDWDMFAGQYFDRFDVTRNVMRAEAIDWKPWWQRWISIDWGFEHPAAVYWHAAVPRNQSVARAPRDKSFLDGPLPDPNDRNILGSSESKGGRDTKTAKDSNCIVSYREYVTHHTAPRDLARGIIDRSLQSSWHSDDENSPDEDLAFRFPAQREPKIAQQHSTVRYDNPRGSGAPKEHIDAIYLSPDAFARRTDEASIAEQMGDIFVAGGLPRPVPADNDRIGGWMLMYQMLDAGEWLLTDNCIELIRTLPSLVRDQARVEDVEKMDGDDPADAARYGLKSRCGVNSGACERLPLGQRLAARVVSTDPTIRAIQARKAEIEEAHCSQPVLFSRRRRYGRTTEAQKSL